MILQRACDFLWKAEATTVLNIEDTSWPSIVTEASKRATDKVELHSELGRNVLDMGPNLKMTLSKRATTFFLGSDQSGIFSWPKSAVKLFNDNLYSNEYFLALVSNVNRALSYSLEYSLIQLLYGLTVTFSR